MTKFYAHLRIAARAAVTLILISLISPLVAQQAVLKIQLQKPDNTAASGTITINGSETGITDDAFTGSATYTLKVATAASDVVEAVVSLYPNPADGVVTLDLPSALADATLEVRNVAGALLLKTSHASFGRFSSPVILSDLTPGILFFTLTNDEQKVTLKLVSQGSSLRINITGGISDTGKGTVLKAASADDDYTITFSESTGNLDGQTWYRTVLLGQTATIDEPLVWSSKEFFIEGTTSNDATITITSGGEEITAVATTAGVIPSTTLSKRFDSETGLPVTIQVTAPFADEVSFNKAAFPGEILTVDTMLNRHFNVTATVRNKDDNTIVTVKDNKGDTLAQGVSNEELTVVERADNLPGSSIIITAPESDTLTITRTLLPGNNNESVVLTNNFSTLIRYTRIGAKICGVFNGRTVIEYISNGDDETHIFSDTLTQGVLQLTQTKEYCDTIVERREVTKGDNEIWIGEGYANYYVTTYVSNSDISNKVDIYYYLTPIISGKANDTLTFKYSTYSMGLNIFVTDVDADTVIIRKTAYPGPNFFSTTLTYHYSVPVDAHKGVEVTGVFNGRQVFSYTASDETETVMFKDTLLHGELVVTQQQDNYNSVTDTIDVTKGVNGTFTLNTMTGRYTCIADSVLTGSMVTWLSAEGDTLERGVDITQLYREYPLDSITVTAVIEMDNYDNDTILFENVKPGTTTLTARQIPVVNSYTIQGRGHLIGALIPELPNDAIDFLTGGDIHIVMKKDNTEFDIPIGADGGFSGDVTGRYAITDSVTITFINNPLSTMQTFSVLEKNKPASTGKIRNDNYDEEVAEANTHSPWTQEDYTRIGQTYVASLQATGFIQYEAKTTLEQITGKELNFTAMSDTAMNNPDAIDMIRNVINSGIKSYDRDTLIFVNYLTNISTGEQISTQEQQEQQEAINLLEQEMTTRTGTTLAHTKKITATEIGEVIKKAYVYKEDDQASNLQQGNTPTTWYYSESSTRPTDGISLTIRELGGATLCIRDLPETGTNHEGFSMDENNHYNGLSWIGDIANKTAYIFPETFFRKNE